MAATTSGGTALSYTYDMDGLRLTKTVGSTVHKYIWQGDRLVSEAWGNEYIEFFYDESGMPSSFYYYKASPTTNNGFYYYVTNLQGDIVGIRNSSGGSLATYEYDAWGKLISNAPTAGSIGDKNPLRYRGYYYDSETGLYYLQSRYYDPEVCRFINADEFASTGQGFIGYNMFAYCLNCPANHFDNSGSLACQNSVRVSNDGGSSSRNKDEDLKKDCNPSDKTWIYSIYYLLTSWHFEVREEHNGIHPTYSEVTANGSGWILLPAAESIYHDNGVGKPEEKYIQSDGREAVFDGDTLEPVYDPRFLATYNYCTIYKVPQSGATMVDYAKCVGSYIGHAVVDVIPYYFTFCSNTRSQFEDRLIFWD